MYKKKNKKIWLSIGIIAVCVALAFVFFNKVSDFSIRSVNEDNIICADDYTIEDVKDGDIKVTVDKYGRIDFEGKNKTDTAVEFEICTVTLEEGEYFISSGAKDCSDKTYYLVVEDEDGNKIIADNDFDVDATDEYTISVVVEAGEEIDAKFAPVLVEGDEAGKFFVWFK